MAKSFHRSILVELQCQHRTAIQTDLHRLTDKRLRKIIEHQSELGLWCSTCVAQQRPAKVIGTIRTRDAKKEF